MYRTTAFAFLALTVLSLPWSSDAAAYGLPPALSDEDILARLLDLNLWRAVAL